MDLRVEGRHWSVDRWGNPEQGPNAGLDLAARRMALFDELVRLRYHGLRSGGTAAARELMAGLRQRYGSLLREPMMEVVFSLFMGRAFSAAGHPREGVRIMRDSWESTGNEGLGLAMADLQAIAGDLEAAADTLRGMIARSKTPSGMFRACELLRRVAIELHDPGLLEAVLPLMPDFARDPELRAVVRAKANLWWDRPREADAGVRSSDLTPAGDAIACLARWRRGETSPEDPDLMTRSMKLSPDAVAQHLLARGLACSALGEHPLALEDLAAAESRLAGRALHRFGDLQVLQLVRAARAVVLAEAGRRDEALEVARRLEPSLRPDLFPGILTGEVLSGQ